MLTYTRDIKEEWRDDEATRQQCETFAIQIKTILRSRKLFVFKGQRSLRSTKLPFWPSAIVASFSDEIPYRSESNQLCCFVCP